ncbi:MAG: hypothetical protein ACO3RU_16800 [Planctomycetota bacterium]
MSAPARWKRSAVLAVLLGACGPHPDAGTNHGSTASTPSDFAVEHDFGPIAHGDDATADLRIPVPSTGGPWVPMGFIRSCTCAQHEFLLEEPDGHTRAVTRLGIADPAFAVPADGALILRLTIRTAEKEVADLAPTWTPAQVVLQSTAAGSSRATIPLRFRFGIEAPYRLRPFAHLDLGEVPRPVRFEQSVEIRARDGTAPSGLGTPRCVETLDGVTMREARDFEVRLSTEPDCALLSVALRAGEDRQDGPFSLEVLIPTSDSSYTIRVPVSGTLVPGLRVAPPGWIAFGAFPFDAEREAAVMVTDHDPLLPADFHVVGIEGQDGRDLREHFDARVESVASNVRSRTVHLRYRGNFAERSFRGRVLLARAPAGPACLTIDFAGFDRR